MGQCFMKLKLTKFFSNVILCTHIVHSILSAFTKLNALNFYTTLLFNSNFPDLRYQVYYKGTVRAVEYNVHVLTGSVCVLMFSMCS